MEKMNYLTIQKSIKNKFGDFLRDDKYWTIEKLSERTQLSKQIIERTTNGKHVTSKNLRSICAVTGLSSDYILGLSNKKNIVDTSMYKGVFACIKYLIENKLIQKEAIFWFEDEDPEIVYHLIGEPGCVVSEYIKLKDTLSKGSLSKDASEDLKTMWKNKRKDLFVESYKQEDPDVDYTIRNHLKDQLNSNNNLQFIVDYNSYIEDSADDYENLSLDGVSRYLKNINIPLYKLIAVAKYLSEKNSKEVTMDYFLGLDGEKSGDIPSMDMLFDALIDMEKNHILFSLYNHKEGEEWVCIGDPIVKCFFDAYIEDCDAITNEESGHSFLIKDRSQVNIEKLKDDRFREITDGFAEKKIPKTMPWKIFSVKLPKENSMEACIRWMNNHPEGQTYDGYEKECYEYNKKEQERQEKELDKWMAKYDDEILYLDEDMKMKEKAEQEFLKKRAYDLMTEMCEKGGKDMHDILSFLERHQDLK